MFAEKNNRNNGSWKKKNLKLAVKEWFGKSQNETEYFITYLFKGFVGFV